MIRLFMVLTLMLMAGSAVAQNQCIIFSEYVEGSSYNKAVELYNATGADVDLSLVTIDLYSNGASSPSTSLTLGGILQSGDVYVVAHPSAGPSILAVADMTSMVSNFNGDDALEMSYDGTVVDVLGFPGSNPSWGANTTLRRQIVVCCGNLTFDAAGEWDVLASDTVDGLGVHATNCTAVAQQVRCWGEIKSDYR
jgi:predicted extracellular nuclease